MAIFAHAAHRHIGARALLCINVLLLVAQLTVGAIAWRAIDVQNRAMSELSLISKAARYHQDADTLSANIRADVYAATARAAQDSADIGLDDDARAEHVSDLRRDLRTLAKFDLPADLSESLGKVESVADDFVARAGDAVRAVGAPLSAKSSIAAFIKASDALRKPWINKRACSPRASSRRTCWPTPRRRPPRTGWWRQASSRRCCSRAWSPSLAHRSAFTAARPRRREPDRVGQSCGT